MSDREGPRAGVALSCHGCRHYADMGAHVRSWCRALGEHATFTRQPETPDWCPLHPGALVAVPIPNEAITPPPEIFGEIPASRVRGWNNCRQRIIDSARALGQEIPND